MDSINLFSIVSIAILGSFGHCIGMCGGIVIAYSGSKVEPFWSKAKQTLAHILYSLGRTTTYVIIGVLVGFLGGVFMFDRFTNGGLLVLAGVFMVLAGLSLAGKIGFLSNIEHSLQNQKWYKERFKKFITSKSLTSFYYLGLLNGLLPCGFVYFFAITAASTASPLWGGVVMAIFGLSTIPALFLLGFFVGSMKSFSFRSTALKIAAFAVILYGFYTLYMGFEYFWDPTKTLLNCH